MTFRDCASIHLNLRIHRLRKPYLRLDLEPMGCERSQWTDNSECGRTLWPMPLPMTVSMESDRSVLLPRLAPRHARALIRYRQLQTSASGKTSGFMLTLRM